MQEKNWSEAWTEYIIMFILISVGSWSHTKWYQGKQLLFQSSSDQVHKVLSMSTLPETNSSPLKMDGWKTILSYWEAYFQGLLISGRVHLAR